MKEVRSQKEFDDAYAKGEREFNVIGFVVVLRESSHAELRESSHAELWGSSHAVLWESSHAVLRESSHAVLRESSHAELWESSHAELWESSHAVLRESSHAVLRDFSVAHKLSETVKIKKSVCSVVITPKYPDNMKDWCALKGIKIKNNRIKLWKCTDKNGNDFYTGKINYNKKSEIICPDWKEHYKKECGYGLHLADSPRSALFFCSNKGTARLFEVSANINDCKCFGENPDYPMKIRAKKCRMVKEYPIKDFAI